jgi:hypothetical protein
MRVIARMWSRLRLDWELGLHRLPFFTQKVAVMLLGVLVATLALLGGVVSLVGPPGADGPDHLVPGSTGGSPPVTTRLAPGQAGGQSAAGGGATAPAGDPARVPAGAPGSGHAPAGPKAPARTGGTAAAPPTTTAPTTTTTGQGGLPPLGGVVSSVVSTLLP